MVYDYKVFDEIYNLIITGKKNLEIRLLNDKSKKIKTNDLVRFTNIDDENKKVIVKVKDKRIYTSLDELLKNEDFNKIYPSKEKIKELLINVYNKELNKVALIEFELMEEIQ